MSTIVMSPQDWLALMAVGAGFGVLGQSARVLIGVKKRRQELQQAAVNRAAPPWDQAKFVLSICYGAAAGAAAALGMGQLGGAPVTPAGDLNALSGPFVAGLLAAGYSGADFLEGALKAPQA